jgi:hypothetical protein
LLIPAPPAWTSRTACAARAERGRQRVRDDDVGRRHLLEHPGSDSLPRKARS